ncbi:MAG: uroporphyrinogen synthase [Spirochaetota bacterium]
MPHLIRIGSRKSTLARLQTFLVADAIRKLHPDIQIEYYFRESLGDKDLQSPLWQMRGRGVFTKDFQDDLLQKKYDLVVHSWKDLELESIPETKIIPVLQRADARDILLFKKAALDNTPREIRLMSSSPRREYNLSRYLKKAFPLRLQKCKISFNPVRGNIQTRIKKWQESSDTQGIVIAKAALDRLLQANFPEAEAEEFPQIRNYIRSILDECVFMVLPLSENPNAPAQGALALEILSENTELLQLLTPLTQQEVAKSVGYERQELKKYGGGCHQKIGVAHQKVNFGNFFSLRGKTDAGETLHTCLLEKDHFQPQANTESQLCPLHGEGFHFTRKPIPIQEVPTGPLWISRSSAWQDHWQQKDLQQIIWCAGVKTLYDLASKNIWVHGTADGLGESNDGNLQHVAGKQIQFRKLTHSKSSEIDSHLARITTYELLLERGMQSVEEKEFFFWMSGYQFDLALQEYPQIAHKYHACGPGITVSHIQKKLGENGKLDIFLNYREWKKYHLQTTSE